MKQSIKLLLLIISLFLLQSCGDSPKPKKVVKKSIIDNTKNLGRMTFLRGKVSVKKKSKQYKKAKLFQKIKRNSKIKTGLASKAVITLQGIGDIAISENSEVEITFKHLPKTKESVLSIRNFYGGILSTVKKIPYSKKMKFNVVTPTSVASIRGTSFEVFVDKENNFSSNINVLKGSVAIKKIKNKLQNTSKNQIIEEPILVSAGEMVIIKVDSKKIEVEKISEEVFLALNNRIDSRVYAVVTSKEKNEGEGIIAAILLEKKPEDIIKINSSSNTELVAIVKELIPEKESEAREVIKEEETSIVDTLSKIDKKEPKIIEKKVKNTAPNFLNIKKLLKVSFRVNLNKGIAGKTKFKFDASKTRLLGFSKKDISFRFDLNGDGKWDIPEEGEYTKKSKFEYIYLQDGKFKPIMEVLTKNGIKEIVNAKKIKIDKDYPTLVSAMKVKKANLKQSSYFNGKGSDKNGKIVKYYWDFNGDGSFSYTGKTAQTKNKYNKAGKYKAVLKAVSTDNGIAFDTVVAEVYNAKINIKACKNIRTRIGKNAKFSGSATDVDGKIVYYSWDFDGDKKVDWKSNIGCDVKYKYKKTGKYNAILMVKGKDGQVARDTVRVIVR